MVRIVVSVWEPFWKQITLYQSKSPLFEAANVVQIFTRTSCELAEKVAHLTPNPLPDKSRTVLSIECNGFHEAKKKNTVFIQIPIAGKCDKTGTEHPQRGTHASHLTDMCTRIKAHLSV